MLFNWWFWQTSWMTKFYNQSWRTVISPPMLAALSDLHGAWTAMDGSKRQVSKRTKGLGQFWSEKRCHLSHSDLPFKDVESPSFIQFKQAKAKQVTHGSQISNTYKFRSGDKRLLNFEIKCWFWDVLGMSDHVWWVNLVSAKGMRNPTQTLSWCAVQISFLHIYLWKRIKTTI